MDHDFVPSDEENSFQEKDRHNANDLLYFDQHISHILHHSEPEELQDPVL